MRPSSTLLLVVGLALAVQAALQVRAGIELQGQLVSIRRMNRVVERLGLSDLCITTDARYIRHLALSDPIAPVMNHPGALEHFPGGSFWIPAQ